MEYNEFEILMISTFIQRSEQCKQFYHSCRLDNIISLLILLFVNEFHYFSLHIHQIICELFIINGSERSWTAHTKNCFINIFPVLLMSATKVLAHGLRHAGCRIADPNQIEPSGWERKRKKNWMILNIFYIHLIGAWKNEKKLIFQIFCLLRECFFL